LALYKEKIVKGLNDILYHISLWRWHEKDGEISRHSCMSLTGTNPNGVSLHYAEIVAWRFPKSVSIAAFVFKVDNSWNVVLHNKYSFDSRYINFSDGVFLCH